MLASKFIEAPVGTVGVSIFFEADPEQCRAICAVRDEILSVFGDSVMAEKVEGR